VALHGNGFIAAFVGGLAFGTTAGRRGQPLIPFVEETGALASLLVWLAFGAVAVAPAVHVLNWQIVLYAVLSLTVIRMVPVAAVLVRSGLDRATIALVAWFGPRGLASVVFCLLALEELGSPAADHAAAVITVTVVLSVLAHGATADPVANRYARHLTRQAHQFAGADIPGIPERRLTRRTARSGPDPADSPEPDASEIDEQLPGTAAGRPRRCQGLLGLARPGPPGHNWDNAGACPSGPRSGDCRTEGGHHGGGDGSWPGRGDARRPGRARTCAARPA